MKNKKKVDKNSRFMFGYTKNAKCIFPEDLAQQIANGYSMKGSSCIVLKITVVIKF